MKTIIDFANKVKSLVDGRISNIANVEESPSTHAYAVGKQLIFNGLLCNATSAIAVGDTLAVGTNLALSDNVVEQIYSLNQGLTNSLNNLSHENLLDNPWFTVNQRGVTTYSSDSFGVDRWRCSSMANRKIDVVSDGLKCISTGSGNTSQVMYQGIDALERQLKGKTVTLSCFIKEITPDTSLYMLIRNSNWTSIKAIMISSTGYHSFTIDIPADATDLLYIDFELVNNTAADKYFVIRSIKLELGSVSTLAMDTAPNYQQELAKCQRYFYRANMNIYCTYGIAAAWSTTAARMLYQTPVPMRVRPAITLGDISAFRLINGSTNLPITNAILYGADNTDKFYLELYATTVSGTIYTFNMAATSYIDFSADLL